MSENNGSKRPEVRRKISEACKGRPAWNKGKHPTKKTLQRMSEARKGQHYSPATEFKWGQVPWNKGLTREADERIKKANGIK